MLASLIGALISGEAADAARRVRATAIADLLAIAFFLCGGGFLVAAAYVAAARDFGYVTTAVCFGVGFVVLGGIVLAVHALLAAKRRRQRQSRLAAELAPFAGAAIAAGLPLLLKRAGPALALAPLLAALGYAVYRENSSRDRPDPESGE